MTSHPIAATWWDQFLVVITSPTAAANMVLTFLGAGIAFVGALLLFRRQLIHDRRLVQEQLTAERTARIHEARRLSARQLGTALIRARDEWNSSDDVTLFDAVRTPGFQGSLAAPGARTAYEAALTAQHELDIDEAIFDLWRARLAWWHAVRRVHQQGRLRDLSEADQAHVLFNAADFYFARNSGQFLQLGRALLRWDGVGDVPTVSEIDRKVAANVDEISASIEALVVEEREKLRRRSS